MTFAQEEPKFSKKKIKVNGMTVEAEIADNDELRQHGLMFRKELKDGKGMLFIFESERTLAFWMKNTFIPLSIGYFNAQKKLVDIQNMKPVESTMVENPPAYPSSKPAQFALEVPLNWFAKNKIKLGAKLEVPK